MVVRVQAVIQSIVVVQRTEAIGTHGTVVAGIQVLCEKILLDSTHAVWDMRNAASAHFWNKTCKRSAVLFEKVLLDPAHTVQDMKDAAKL